MPADFDTYCEQRMLELMLEDNFDAAHSYAEMWGRTRRDPATHPDFIDNELTDGSDDI